MFFKHLLGNILYFISYIIPKSKKVWVFGSWGGQQFADNPKYFYNYVKRNKNIKPIWLSENHELIKKLKVKGILAYHTYSFLGIWFSSRASIGVVSHGLIDINRYACARMKIIQTWHGIPMKPVLLSDKKEIAVKKRKMLLKLMFFFPFLKKELLFDRNFIICSSSSHVENLLKKIFGNNSPLHNVGFPRLDGLFKPKNDTLIYQIINNYKDNGFQVGVYMPTYRREGEFDIISFLIQNKDEIEGKLYKCKTILYVKLHPFDYFKINDEFHSETIRIINDESIDNDIYQILNCFDFLISDYSSIVFDFLTLVKPIYLLVPDRESYITSNGDFVYDYLNINLPVVESWSGALSLIENKIEVKNLEKISSKYHLNMDGNNSERLYNVIVKKLN